MTRLAATMQTAASALAALRYCLPPQPRKLVGVGDELNRLNHLVRHVECQDPDRSLAGGPEDGRSVVSLAPLHLQIRPPHPAAPFPVRHLPDREEEARHLVGTHDRPPRRAHPPAAV